MTEATSRLGIVLIEQRQPAEKIWGRHDPVAGDISYSANERRRDNPLASGLTRPVEVTNTAMKHKLLLWLCPLAFVLTNLGCTANAQDFSGTYGTASSTHPLRLTLEEAARGQLSGTLDQSGATFILHGAVIVDEEDGAAAVEGQLSGPQMQGSFMLEGPDEEGDFYLLITPHDPSGVPRLSQSVSYLVQRREEGDPVGTATSPTAADRPSGEGLQAGSLREPGLVGMWATQVIMNDPAGGIATQLRMEFRSDGVLVDHGARTLGGVFGGDFDSGHRGTSEPLAWHTQGNTLLVRYPNMPWVPLAQFELAGDRLLLSYLQDGSRQLWHRQ